VEHLLDESDLEELSQLYSDRPAQLLVEAAQLLLHSAEVR
jgi:hypothetical protein